MPETCRAHRSAAVAPIGRPVSSPEDVMNGERSPLRGRPRARPARYGPGSTQTPVTQVPAVPHEPPSFAGVVPFAHVWLPLAQEVTPSTQTFVFPVQIWFAVQATHVPLPLQTRLAPQLVPASSGAAVSSQTGEPVVQEVVPATHGFKFVAQNAPALHGLHTPALHTRSVPQLVPFATGTAVSTLHSSTPVEQDVW